MAWSFLINFLPSTGGHAIWRLKEFLVAQGWVVTRSADGTTFSNVGDVHAPGGTYAGSLDLANAWLEIKQPVGSTPRRSFLFQTPSTAGNVWRIWYSSDGTGFKWSYSHTASGGSIALVGGTTYRITDAGAAWIAGDVGQTIRIVGATTPANNGDFVVTARTGTTIDYTNAAGVAEAFSGTTYVDTPNRTGTGLTATLRGIASDEQGIANTPASSTQWLPNNGTYRMEVMVGNAAENYSMFFGARVTQENAYASVLSLDVLEGADVADVDGAIIGTHFQGDSARFALASSGGWIGATAASQTSGCSRGWYKKTLTGANFVVFPPIFWGNQEGLAAHVPLNNDRQTQAPDNSFQDFQVWYWRGSATHTTERGFKGKSKLFRTSQPRLGSMRPNLGRTRMSLGTVSVPWDGATVPIF